MEAVTEQVALGNTLAISAVTVAEIYHGLRPSEESETEAVLATLIVYDVTETIARRAGKLMQSNKARGKTLTMADTLIAATALEFELALATDNRRDFPMSDIHFVDLP